MNPKPRAATILIAVMCSAVSIPLDMLWSFQSTQSLLVTGKIVNATRQPVANARVILLPSQDKNRPEVAADELIVVHSADSDGRFKIPIHTRSESKPVNAILYVTDPVPPQTFAPLDAPFTDVSGRRFIQGIPITLQGVPLDLGELRTNVHFGVVRVVLHDRRGHEVRLEKGIHFYMIIHNSSGDLLSKATIPESASYQGSEIRLAFPYGRWTVEIYPETKSTVVFLGLVTVRTQRVRSIILRSI